MIVPPGCITSLCHLTPQHLCHAVCSAQKALLTLTTCKTPPQSLESPWAPFPPPSSLHCTHAQTPLPVLPTEHSGLPFRTTLRRYAAIVCLAFFPTSQFGLAGPQGKATMLGLAPPSLLYSLESTAGQEAGVIAGLTCLLPVLWFAGVRLLSSC